MVSIYRFKNFVESATQQQALLARIFLNVSYDPDAYPIDISKLDHLNEINAAVVSGLLSWCATNKSAKYKMRDRDIYPILRILEGHNGGVGADVHRNS